MQCLLGTGTAMDAITTSTVKIDHPTDLGRPLLAVICVSHR